MFKYNSKLIPRARELRKNQTPQEKRLWYDLLRLFPERFQRQKSIGNYIVDFYCHKYKLAIEIDGGQHFEDKSVEYDKIRTEYLNSLGVTVLRFTNDDVNRNFSGVCYMIEEFMKSQRNMN